jgi:hypothetical protein
MKRGRTFDKALTVFYADPGLGHDELFTVFESRSIYRSPDNSDPHALSGSVTKLAYSGSMTPLYLSEVGEAIFTAFDNHEIYLSELGENLGGGGFTQKVYCGPYNVLKIIPDLWLGGALTVWQIGSVYRSFDGQNLGGGGSTQSIYPPKPVDVLVYNGQLIIAFDDTHIYKCSSPNNLHGGPGTVDCYYDPQQGQQNVVSKLMLFGTGVLTAFKWGGIYYSGDGLNLGGGGNPATHYRVYPEPHYLKHYKMTAMVAYKSGVITAFDNNKIYYSTDGLHLGNVTANTQLVYNWTAGQPKLVSIACADVGDGSGEQVVTVFDNGYMYLSPDGCGLGDQANLIYHD